MSRVYADKIKVFKDPVSGWVGQFYRGALLVFTMAPAAGKVADIFVMTGLRVSSDRGGDPDAVRKMLGEEIGKAAARAMAAVNDGELDATPELKQAVSTLAQETLFRLRNEG